MKTKILLFEFLLCAASLSFGQWTTTNLSAPKAYMGAVVLNHKAYFAGGSNNSGLLSKIEIYDTDVNGGWIEPDNLSVARDLPFAAACGSKIFFAGGADFYGTGAVYSTIDIFDTLSQEWTVKQLSVPRLQAAVVSYGNKILFAGGANFQQQLSYDIVDIYDVQNDEWTTAQLSEPRTTWWALVGDKAIFAGGFDFPTVSKRVDIYNFTTDTWSIDSLSVARGFVGMTAVGNKVLIAGGMTSENVPSDVVDIYDATTGTWTTSNLSFPRAFCDNQNAVTLNGKAYFVGGGYINLITITWQTAYNVIDIYDAGSNTWTVDNLSQSFVHRAVVALDNKILVAGGVSTNGVYQSAVEIFAVPRLIHVPDDYSTIQEGIDAANSGDTVLVADGLYYENINFLGKKPLMVASEFLLDGDTSHISNTIINGSQPDDPDMGTVVTFSSGEDTTSVLCGFTITGGTGTFVAEAGDARMGGGVFISESGGKLLNNHIENNIVTNTSWVIGGGVNAAGPDVPYEWVVLHGNRITNNQAISQNDIASGGGVVCYYNLIMKDNQISNNSAEGHLGGDGGGVAILGGFGPITIDVSENEITHNEAITDIGTSDYATLGGGIGIYFDVTGNISNNDISYNSMRAPNTYRSWGPGAFMQDITSNGFIFENNIVNENIANTENSWGGGLSLLRAGGIYQNNVLQNNSAYNGGGISIVTSNEVDVIAVLINNTITENVANFGGGIYVKLSKAVIINSIVWGNDATTEPSIYQIESTLEVRYSDVEGDEIWPGEGNINVDPEFQIDGYHLDYPSTLLNEGASTVLINGEYYDCPLYDIDGDERPYEWTNPDIGADEAPWLYVSVEEFISSNIILFPNPANRFVTISNENGKAILEVTLYNQTGQKVYRGIPENNTLDISKLQPGIYIVEVVTKEGNLRKKLIVQ